MALPSLPAVLEPLPWLHPAWQQWLSRRMRLGHAYLLPAAEGIAVEQLVLAMSAQMLCQMPSAQGGCGRCVGCHLFAAQQHPDFYHLHPLEEKKEVGVDQVRALIQRLNETSHQGGYKVIWIEAVEHLNLSAFNALLKTLEEPANQTLFLLSCQQTARLPATIRSRCQQLSIGLPDFNSAILWLQQQRPQFDHALLKRALRLNWGAPLAAQAWLDQGRLQEYRQWQEGLKALHEGRKTPSKVAAPWLKWPQPERLFDYFYHWVLSELRRETYANCPANKTILQRLLQFEKQLQRAKTLWQGNANKELVAENLLQVWLSAQSPNVPATMTIFHSVLNRGDL
ncbi:MAG: DNA-directed DNA polymerase [Thiotrichales bacterium]|nr:DNA-directed DNA polymerase [Thiotrichales bacterium]